MENYKSIQSKKFFKSSKIKNILKNNNFVVFLNHVGSNVKDSLAFKSHLLNKYNLVFANVKNKPLVTLLSKTKYEPILPVFQGNSSIIFQDMNSLTGFENKTVEELILNKEFKKLLFENSDIVPMGFLINKNTFVTPELFKSLSCRGNDIRGITTASLLTTSSRNLIDSQLLGSSYNILRALKNHKNSESL
jgi:hypothetical protein